jgi:predicted nucleic acid-binding protein
VNIFIDADVFIRFEKGEFDLVAWLEDRPTDNVAFPATVWQQLLYGVHAWDPSRARKRLNSLQELGLPVCSFARRHASLAAQIAAELRTEGIGFSDCQIAATVIAEGGDLLTFNSRHFSRVRGLRLAQA